MRNKKNILKRICAIFMAVLMVCSSLPFDTVAAAQDAAETEAAREETPAVPESMTYDEIIKAGKALVKSIPAGEDSVNDVNFTGRDKELYETYQHMLGSKNGVEPLDIDADELTVLNTNDEDAEFTSGGLMDYIYWKDGEHQIGTRVKYVADDPKGSWRMAYCVQLSKHFINATKYISKDWKSNGMYSELSWVMAHGCSRYKQKSDAAYTTNSWTKDYYVTQVVIWCILDDYGQDGCSFKSLKAVSGYQDVYDSVSKMYKAVKEFGENNDDGYGDDPYYKIVAPSSVAMAQNAAGTYYETDWYTIDTEGDLVSRTISLSEDAPDGAEIYYNDKGNLTSKFKVRIPVNKISKLTESKYSFKVTSSAAFNRDKSYIYKSRVADAQNVTFTETGKDSGSKEYSAKVTLSLTGNLSISKTVSAQSKSYAAMVKNNDCYSLKGTEYGVYETKSNADAANGKWVWKIILDEEGNTSKIISSDGSEKKASAITEKLGLERKIYYIRELVAGPGYRLDTTTYTADILQDGSVELELSDTPLYVRLEIVKRELATGSATPSGSRTFVGTKFNLSYYKEYYKNWDEAIEAYDQGKRDRVWKLEVISDADNVILDEDHKAGGNSFYVDEEGNAVIPLGTITLNENAGSDGYTTEGMQWRLGANSMDNQHAIRIREHIDPGTGEKSVRFQLENGTYVNSDNAKLQLKADNPIQNSKLTITKSVSTESKSYAAMVEGNSCYSLKGTKYGVYEKKADADAANDKWKWKTVLDDNGKATKVISADGTETKAASITDKQGLEQKIYYIRELAAGSGYRLDTTTYTADLTEKESVALKLTDIPLYATLEIIKRDLESASSAPYGKRTFVGTSFNLSYYQEYLEDWDTALAAYEAGKRDRVWKLQVISDSDKVVFDDDHRTGGNSFYVDADGKGIIPLGTITLNENGGSDGYTTEGMQWRFGGSSFHNKQAVQIREYTDSATGEKSVRFQLENGTYVNTNNAKLQLTADNPRSYGSLTITKVDAETKQKLAGATFNLLDEKGNIYKPADAGVDNGNIDKNGLITIQPDGTATVKNMEPGKYSLKEVKASKGYLTAKDKVNVTVDLGKNTETVENEPIKIGVKLQKADANTGKSTPEAGASFKGAEFTITALEEVVINQKTYQKGAVITTLTTDDGGYAEKPVGMLSEGKYLITETKTPLGYKTCEPEEFTLTEADHGKIISLNSRIQSVKGSDYLTFAQTPILGGIQLDKGDIDRLTAGQNAIGKATGDGDLSGAVFEIINNSTNPVKVGGKEYAKGEVIEGLTLTTDKNGHARTINKALPYGQYQIREKAAPEGYFLSDYVADVDLFVTKDGQVAGPKNGSGVINNVYVDTIKRGGIRIPKVDRDRLVAAGGKAENIVGRPTGDATLEGAEFTIYNNSAESVFVDGKEYAAHAAIMKITTDAYGVAQTSASVLPYGTYVIEETKAPTGYKLSGYRAEAIVHTAGMLATPENGSVKADGWVLCDAGGNEINAVVANSFVDDVIRGGLEIAKYDLQTEECFAQGSATLAGGEFTIYNKSKDSVYVDGTWYEPDTAICTLVTDKNGYATTSNDFLPYGTYLVVETKAPEGFLGETETSEGCYRHEFRIRTHGEKERAVNWGPFHRDDNGLLKADDGFGDDDQGAGFANRVKRGDFEFIKIAGDTQTLMGGIPFKLTSHATGENHIIVTDENGYYSSENSYVNHSYKTNSGEAETGLWFGQNSKGENVPVRDDLGALPYDTYTLEELPCEANAGRALYKGTFRIYREKWTVNLGTFENQRVSIMTTAKDRRTGSHYQLPEEGAVIVDTVAYTNLTYGAKYTLVAELYNKNTILPLRDKDGRPVTATKRFTCSATVGSVDVEILFDAASLAGCDVVVFESLYEEGTEEPIAEHKDITDEGQTIHYPSIGTTARNPETGGNTAVAAENACIVDTVSYENLQPGREYTLEGILMDKTTGEPLLVNGKKVSASVSFVPENPDGTAEVPFIFDARSLKTTEVVVFEFLYNRDRDLWAKHDNLEDEGQTIHFPHIRTTATDADTGGHTGNVSQAVTIIDQVRYSGLTAGNEYIVEGNLIDKMTGEPILDARGEEIISEKTFVAPDTKGVIEVVFSFDGSHLAGRSLVVFEDLYQEGSEPGVKTKIAEHRDPEDEEQSVKYPEEPDTSEAVETPAVVESSAVAETPEEPEMSEAMETSEVVETPAVTKVPETSALIASHENLEDDSPSTAILPSDNDSKGETMFANISHKEKTEKPETEKEVEKKKNSFENGPKTGIPDVPLIALALLLIGGMTGMIYFGRKKNPNR